MTFSGTASMGDKCFEGGERPVSLIIGEAAGNAFRGEFAAKIGDHIKSRAVRGFLYVPKKQLIVVPEEYDASALALVCTRQEDSNNAVNCQVLTDHMTATCGSVLLNKDRTSKV